MAEKTIEVYFKVKARIKVANEDDFDDAEEELAISILDAIMDVDDEYYEILATDEIEKPESN